MQSGIVQFVVGKDRKQFSIHTELVSFFPSENLRSPIVEEIDEVIFSRCCEFVYSGDYSVPFPVYDPYGGQRRIGIQPSKESVRRWNPANITNFFHPELLPRVCADLLERLDQAPKYQAKEELNTDPKHDHTEIFICHAELYRFARRMNWASLCYLSVYRLLRLLANFNLCEERTGDVVTLMKFIFEETDGADMGNMDSLLRDYAVWNVETLMQDVDFRHLLDRVPSLAKDIFRKMWE
ncbi:hypothetical protein F1880_007971 [Penicillium rolfsii]|nr:hypothetical protein F1880_007971 [Penicillium rolfsii]